MDLSGTVLRQVAYVSGGGTHSYGVVPRGGVRVSARPRMVMGGSGFGDEGHLQYYQDKKKGPVVMTTKKKLKLLKGLSKGLNLFPQLGFDLDPEKRSLVDDIQGSLTSEATEILMKQLEQLRGEEKAVKRKRKQEKKAKLKASKAKMNCESSSSSSESSDSECGEVVVMNSLRAGVAPAPVEEVQPPAQEVAMPSPPALVSQTTAIVENPREDASAHHHAIELCSRNDTCVSSVSASFKNESTVVSTAPEKRIEVCMGNKCKRSGAAALLQEFERVMRVEGGAVVECKCMGKCKSAPNVRIQNSVDDGLAEGLNDSVKIPANPLCIGVGLEDVNTIVARFLGENQKDMGMAAPAT